MKTARYKYRLYPTPEQRQNLAQTFGCARFAYNWALRLRSDAYHEEGVSLGYGDTSKRLTALKKEADYHWLNDVSSVPVQQALRHLDTAYKHFFKGHQAFPSFKSKRHKQSAEYTTSAYRLQESGVAGQPVVKLAKQKGALDIRWSRPLPSAPKTITISKDAAGRYFVSFVVQVDPSPLAPRDKAVGVDLGISHALVTSDGYKFANPRYAKHLKEKLAREQRKLSRKRAPSNGAKGSSNWRKQRAKVARIHAKIADQRHDWAHKVSTKLVRENDTICLETLRVKNMVKNHSLAYAISDVSWSKLVAMIEYKAAWYGAEIVRLDQFYPSSKRCSTCGHIASSMPLSVREWSCPECGSTHDRDVNAAKNLKAAGLAVAERSFGNASGVSVSPDPASAG